MLFFTNYPQASSAYNDPIEILIIVDDGYGANVPPILDHFDDFGWNVTIAGLNQTVTSCEFFGYVTMETDILIPDIEDVTVYDAVSVLPGEAHVNLLSSQTVLDLIKTAANANVVVSGWCKAVRVLAYADVIDGKNVTGHASFIAEYETAGATYVGEVPPVIDGNIVTGVRSNYYQIHKCYAIGKAIGVFESNLPVLGEITVETSSTNAKQITLSVEITEESDLLHAKVRLFEVNRTTGERLSAFSSYYKTLTEQGVGIYRCTIDMEVGLYEADIAISDIYYNEIEVTNCTQIEVIDNMAETTWSYLIPIVFTLLIFTMVLKRKRN